MLIGSRRNKEQSTGRCNCSSHVQRAGIMHALGFQFGNGAERLAPRVFAGIEIECDQFAPRRLLARPTSPRIGKAVVSTTYWASAFVRCLRARLGRNHLPKVRII